MSTEPLGSKDSDQNFRILLAEDKKLNQLLTQKLLARSGFVIDIVENGADAVAAARQRDYDVILMDVQMPELDGIEATRQIRALPPPRCNVPIIAVTATASPEAQSSLLSAGMNDFISKPINFDILFTKLSTLADKRAA